MSPDNGPPFAATWLPSCPPYCHSSTQQHESHGSHHCSLFERCTSSALVAAPAFHTSSISLPCMPPEPSVFGARPVPVVGSRAERSHTAMPRPQRNDCPNFYLWDMVRHTTAPAMTCVQPFLVTEQSGNYPRSKMNIETPTSPNPSLHRTATGIAIPPSGEPPRPWLSVSSMRSGNEDSAR